MRIGSATASITALTTASQTQARTNRQNDTAATFPGVENTYQRSMGTTASDASNVLGNNFVHTNSDQSKYIAATLLDLQTDLGFKDKMGSLLDSLKGQYAQLANSGASQYVAATLMQHRVEEGVQQVTDDEYMDESANTLSDIKDDIEQKAEEATQPQDGEDQTTQDASQGETDPTATATTPATAPTATAVADVQETANQQTGPLSGTGTPAENAASGATTTPAGSEAGSGLIAAYTAQPTDQTQTMAPSVDILI